MSCSITIILPVYGRSALLKEALSSVYAQSDPHWFLHIADDGSDVETARIVSDQLSDPRVSCVRRPENIGLFANLNLAIYEVKTPWQLILCSDDKLMPDAIKNLKASINENPRSLLILSSYQTIDIDGCPRYDCNGKFYDCFVPVTHEFSPGELLIPLLRYGSINGNITGMLINNSLFRRSGLWRSEWTQAADWEWLIRACTETSVLIRRQAIAKVRVHDGQLSVSNQKTQRELLETLEVLRTLVNHPALESCSARHSWAAFHAQLQLWNIIKRSRSLGIRMTIIQLQAIHHTIGLRRTIQQLLKSLPGRLRVYGTDLPLLPPS